MAITLAKTLQNKPYTLYIVSEVLAPAPGNLVSRELVYESHGHHDEGFLIMMLRNEVVTDPATVDAVRVLYGSNPAAAVSLLEHYLIETIPWYNGGTVS